MVIRKALVDILIAIVSIAYGPKSVKDKNDVRHLFILVLETLYGFMKVSMILYEKKI